MIEMTDYSTEGIDIQTAMLRHVRAFPDRSLRPPYLLWGGQKVFTSYTIHVPSFGRLRLEFLSVARAPRQGFDVKTESGGIFLARGEAVHTLRTWNDERYERSVEYAYRSAARRLIVWNVYEREWPGGRMTEERWTGNAGFVVSGDTDRGLVFHCSHGPARSPDFEQLVVRVLVSPE
jgi:hypothetical protein